MSVKKNQAIVFNDTLNNFINTFQDKPNTSQVDQTRNTPGSMTDNENNQAFWQLLLIETARLTSSSLLESEVFEDDEPGIIEFKHLKRPFENLKVTGKDRDEILIRYQADPHHPDKKNKSDYEILYGSMVIGTGVVPKLFNVTLLSHFSQKLIRAFNIFAHHRFNQLYLKLPREKSTDQKQVRSCLQILSCFKVAHQNCPRHFFSYKGKQVGFPHPGDLKSGREVSLDFLKDLKKHKSKTIQEKALQLKQWMESKVSFEPVCPYYNVNYAIINIKERNSRTVNTSYKIDHVKWLMLSRGNHFDVTEKNQLTQFVLDNYKGSPRKIAGVLQNAYENNFERIGLDQMDCQFQQTVDESHANMKNPSKEKHESKALNENDELRLDHFDDEIFDQIYLHKNKDRFSSSLKYCTILVALHEDIDKMIAFCRDIKIDGKRLNEPERRPIYLHESNYDKVAKEFNSTFQEARNFIELLKSCFDNKGRFQESKFTNILFHFSKYEKKIFEFLWHHLKSAIHKEDRIAFLNSLQFLAKRMRQPIRVLKILLNDFCCQPTEVNFYDNMAIMLANLVVQKYDRDLTDFETTPEDILINKDNIDNALASYASWRIEKLQSKIIQKVSTIHDKLKNALHFGKIGSHQIFVSHLLALEKEVYILLSLKACLTGRAVLRTALYEYGNPDSRIYSFKKSQIHMTALLQNLRVIIYGVGRIGNSDDLYVLYRTQENLNDFLNLMTLKKHRKQVKMMDHCISEAEISIISRF